MNNKNQWTMPEWMESYRSLFYSTGGNSVETLMNALDTPNLSRTNAVVFSLACMAEAQVCLLMRLRKAGLLPTTPETPDTREEEKG